MDRVSTIAAGVMAALLAAVGPALAFEQTPEALPQETSVVAPETKAPVAELQSPGTSGAEGSKQTGVSLFSFGLMPKLDIGLEVLYGDQQQQLQQGPIEELNEAQNVTVLGKVNRRF
jgi:hypothetical protein